ncbi:MAG TPA: hypothetical protein VGD08_17250 [Stellaceae bacterium]
MMHHNAHHLLAGIPLYKLASAQRLVSAPGMPSWCWSWSAFLDICRRCKLFDYQAGRWTDFDGRPTSEPLFPEAKRDRRR